MMPRMRRAAGTLTVVAGLLAAICGRGAQAPVLLFRNGESCEGRSVAVYRIPALASWPDGSLVAVTDARYDDYRDLSDGHPISIACRWSSDGGKSWSVPSILWNCPWNDTEKWAASDPSLIVDERSGAVFCFVNVMEHVGKQGPFYRHFVQRSDDKGKTWAAPTEITKSIRLPHWNAEKYALIPGGNGFQLRDGTLVHTIVCDRQICLFGSSDGGDTWKPIGKPTPGGDECKVVELDDGTLLIDERVDRRMSGRRIHVSHDRGQTWETRLDKTLPDPSCNAGLNVLPVGGHNLLAFSNCASWGIRHGLTLRLSGDGGQTWSAGILIDRDDGGYSEIVRLPDGAAGVIWERIETGLTYFRRIESDDLARDAQTHFADPYVAEWLPCCTQRLAVAFSSAEAAARADIKLSALPPGKKYAFSTRWDDANPRHEQMAATLNPLGVYSTFYINGRPDDSFCRLMRQLVSAGNSIGAHSISHARMERLLPSVSFREIMENRVLLEVSSQSPVSTFVLPYSNAGAAADGYAELRVGQALANAGLIGGAETRRDIAGRYGFPDVRWCASYTFRANDRNPQRNEFNSGFNWGLGLCDKNVLPCGPHLTFGVHSWQSDTGLRDLGDFVEKVSGREDVWYVNENTYAASRIQSLNTRIRKAKVRGSNVLFEVVRPQPYALGAAVDLFMAFTETPQEIMLEGKPIAADRQICLAAPEGAPARFALIPDALKVGADLQTFHADFMNRESDALSDVRFYLRLPPGYEPGVLEAAKGHIAPGERVSLRWKAVRPTDPTLRAGNLYAALEVDARIARERVRYWATLLKRRSHEPLAVPRDNAFVCGPLKENETPSENRLMRLSMPGTTLVDVGTSRFQRWRHAVADTSEAEYAVTIPSSDEGVQIRKDMQLKKDVRMMLLAFEFTADQADESSLWRIVFKAQNAVKGSTSLFLNGRRLDGEGVLFKPCPGINRLLVKTEGTDVPFRYELSVKSVPDGSPAIFQPEISARPQTAPVRPVLGYMLDISRNKVPTMPTLRRIVGILAELGYNQLQLYSEHTFAYAGHESVWKDASPLSPNEIRELDDLCAAHGIELVPNQNSFGHLERWLKHEAYRSLAEVPGGGARIPGGEVSQEACALCPTDSRSIKLIANLYDQLLPCFRSKLLNVGCDEVWELQPEGSGRSRERVRAEGATTVWMDYFRQVCLLAASHGSRVMFWDDMVARKHPEMLNRLPAGVIALDWGYEFDDPDHDFERECTRLKKAGISFYVCPGTSGWNAISGRHDNMRKNVDEAVVAGKRHGAIGFLLTDWGNGGHCQPWMTALPALIYMAERVIGREMDDAAIAARVDSIAGASCGKALIAYQNLYLKCGTAKTDNSTPLYRMLEGGRSYKRPEWMTDERLVDVFKTRREIRNALDLTEAKDWIRDGFAVMDLLYDALELKWKGDYVQVESLVPAYRKLWLKYNRFGGLDESIERNFADKVREYRK